MLIDWIANWQHNCGYAHTGNSGNAAGNAHPASESFVKIHSTQWNSPEGCVSVI
jgi:hypothetical protein